MDTITRVREYLKNKYGISTNEELYAAIQKQRHPDIGIFLAPCKTEARKDDKKAG